MICVVTVRWVVWLMGNCCALCCYSKVGCLVDGLFAWWLVGCFVDGYLLYSVMLQ